MTTKKVNNILIVDDNKTAAWALGELLKRDGYNVEVTYDGETALARTRRATPDAIILDIEMPGKSGYEVADALRRNLHPRVLLIALSGYGQAKDKRMAWAAGFDHHLTKPVLVGEIERLFDVPKIKVAALSR